MKKYIVTLTLVGVLAFSKFLSPLNPMDTGWDFSHAYTVIRGGESVYYSNYISSTTDYLYGLLIVPLAVICKSAYTPSIFYTLMLCAMAVVLHLYRKRYALSILTVLVIVSNYNILMHRPEVMSMLLGIIAFPFILRDDKIKWFVAIPFACIMCAIHPANAILLGAGILATKDLLVRPNKVFLYTYLSVIILFGYLLTYYGDAPYLSTLKARITSGNQIPAIKNFLMVSGTTLIALAIAKRKIWTVTFALNFAVLLLLCILLGPFYYYIFLFIPFILSPKQAKGKWTSIALSVALLFNVGTNVIHKYAISIENKSYAYTASNIITKLERFELQDSSKNIYINQHIGLPIYANYAQAKMIMVDHSANEFYIFCPPKSGDIAFFSNRQNAQLFKAYLGNKYDLATSKILELENPVRGNLTLQSLYQNRLDSLGLFTLTIE